VDLRAARVEPDHRSSACGRAQDLAGAPLVDLRRTSTEPPLVGRSAAEATRRWRIHPTVSAHTGEGLGRRLGRALSGAAHRLLRVARCGAREGAEEKRNEARVCATEPERGFVRSGTSRSRWI
jgi:hypothetical protein